MPRENGLGWVVVNFKSSLGLSFPTGKPEVHFHLAQVEGQKEPRQPTTWGAWGALTSPPVTPGLSQLLCTHGSRATHTAHLAGRAGRGQEAAARACLNSRERADSGSMGARRGPESPVPPHPESQGHERSPAWEQTPPPLQPPRSQGSKSHQACKLGLREALGGLTRESQDPQLVLSPRKELPGTPLLNRGISRSERVCRRLWAHSTLGRNAGLGPLTPRPVPVTSVVGPFDPLRSFALPSCVIKVGTRETRKYISEQETTQQVVCRHEISGRWLRWQLEAGTRVFRGEVCEARLPPQVLPSIKGLGGNPEQGACHPSLRA